MASGANTEKEQMFFNFVEFGDAAKYSDIREKEGNILNFYNKLENIDDNKVDLEKELMTPKFHRYPSIFEIGLDSTQYSRPSIGEKNGELIFCRDEQSSCNQIRKRKREYWNRREREGLDSLKRRISFSEVENVPTSAFQQSHITSMCKTPQFLDLTENQKCNPELKSNYYLQIEEPLKDGEDIPKELTMDDEIDNKSISESSECSTSSSCSSESTYSNTSVEIDSPVDERFSYFHSSMRKARILFLNEKWCESFQFLQSLLDNMSLNNEERVAVLYNQAISLHEEQEWDWAINIVDDILLLNPQHALTWELKGDLHMALQEYDKAEQAYRMSLVMEDRPVVHLKKNESKYKILQWKISKYLAILGLDASLKESLTLEKLRSQYKKICKLIHPDRVSNASDPLLIEKRFSKIQEAYKFLREMCIEAEKRLKMGEQYQLITFKSVASPVKEILYT